MFQVGKFIISTASKPAMTLKTHEPQQKNHNSTTIDTFPKLICYQTETVTQTNDNSSYTIDLGLRQVPEIEPQGNESFTSKTTLTSVEKVCQPRYYPQWLGSCK